MEINHDSLLQIGFRPRPNRPNHYIYQGFIGQLLVESGQFFFHGFSLGITTLVDLKYMLMLIDYKH